MPTFALQQQASYFYNHVLSCNVSLIILIQTLSLSLISQFFFSQIYGEAPLLQVLKQAQWQHTQPGSSMMDSQQTPAGLAASTSCIAPHTPQLACRHSKAHYCLPTPIQAAHLSWLAQQIM